MIKKGEKTKILILVILLVIVLGMSIVYASLSQTINITGTAQIASDWNIKITNVALTNESGATDKPGSPSFTATKVNFNVDLASPGSVATYTITIKNDGKIPARLNSIKGIELANIIEPLELQFATNATIGDTLAPGDIAEYTITVRWNSESAEIPEVKTKTATIEFEYVQNT